MGWGNLGCGTTLPQGKHFADTKMDSLGVDQLDKISGGLASFAPTQAFAFDGNRARFFLVLGGQPVLGSLSLRYDGRVGYF